MRKTFGFFLVLLAGGIILALYPLWVLVLSAKGEIFFLRVVRPGDTFLLGYLHSVSQSDVWDRFQIDSDYQIVLTETMYKGQGYGLPSSLAANEQLIREDDWFKITGMRRVVPSLAWRVESRWHNRFRFKDEKEQDMSSRLGDVLVHIQVRKLSVLSWLRHYLKGRIP